MALPRPAVSGVRDRPICPSPIAISGKRNREQVLGKTSLPSGVWLHRRRPSRYTFPIGKARSEEHTSELQSLMRISYAVFFLKKKKQTRTQSLNLHLHTQTLNTT